MKRRVRKKAGNGDGEKASVSGTFSSSIQTNRIRNLSAKSKSAPSGVWVSDLLSDHDSHQVSVP